MRYFADAARVTPLVIPELSRRVSPIDLLVILKLVRLFFRLRRRSSTPIRPRRAQPDGLRLGSTEDDALVLWLRPRRCHVVHTFHGHIFHGYYSSAKTQVFLMIERILLSLATDRIITSARDNMRNWFHAIGSDRPRSFALFLWGWTYKSSR